MDYDKLYSIMCASCPSSYKCHVRCEECDEFSEALQQEEWEFYEIDADYERAYGPVDSQEKYDAYLKWKKEAK